MPNAADKRRIFKELHQSGCFVIPNPWNVGSALYLQSLGFPALASTSSGHAYSLGYPDDGQLGRDVVLAHYAELAAATTIPLNADFENGYAHEPDALADNVRLCIDTGVAGLSIEDFTGDESAPLYDFDKAVARVRAARQAIDKSGSNVLLTGRAEGFLHGRLDLDDAIRRLTAFADAGADCVYVPGIKTREQIEAVVKAVAPKPVNLLMSSPSGFTVADVAGMGVRRISVGGALARVAMDAFIKAATLIADEGKFDRLGGIISGTELDAFFARNAPSEQ
ncbi:isocitrate lyase/PEP mutase family protein [Undibacter mobilis]|uniref:Isocitrate lyase/phosphoenolpyruvate mutase family protein n=1 Tax=Undibacter mobilis TaxID=2292256 RepID=A0A371B9Y7_9BRAD|nr:isocitrate lyase/phosphoenolpyruvate mutase family protein [Undibacter mobilis]RDV04398.1 isocitrate lyase/phosphoenolpyruvate mutase family protein [Undibacter mobilis]